MFKSKRFIIPVVILAVVLFLRFVVFFLATVPSESMLPTIHVGDQLLVNKWDKDYKRGDIIVFKYPDDESILFIKRIIGEPGDTVEINSGKTYVNGKELEESYILEPEEGGFGPYTVPDDNYFVLGDNRNNSKDARFWNNTYVSKDKIIGKAFYVWFPFNRIRIL